MESKDYLDAKPVDIRIIMMLLWGFNYTTIKYSNRGVSPNFASSLGSMIAFICALMTISSMIGLPMVSIGISMVNWRRRMAI